MKPFVQIDPVTTEPIGIWSPGPDGTVEAHFLHVGPDRDVLKRAASNGPAYTTSWEVFAAWLCDEDDEIYPVEVPPGSSLEAVLDTHRQAWAGTTGAPGSSKFNAAIRRRRFAAEMEVLAANVAGRLPGHTAAHTAPLRWPAPHVARTSEDGSALIIGVQAGESPRDVDALLATGLVLQGDRDLHLLLPNVARAGSAGEQVWEATAARAAWLDTPIWLWSYDATLHVQPIQSPPTQEVLDGRRQDVPVPIEPHDLGAMSEWVGELAAWADSHTELRSADRKAYRAWHVDGRKVLEVRASGAKLHVAAGHGPDDVLSVLAGPLSGAELAAMTTAIGHAAARRLSGEDDGDAEGRLQSRLAEDPSQIGLQSPLVRELPLLRPGSPDWAFVDLVGVDTKGHVHLVETKVKRDWMLGLQALDYWLWGKANLDLLVATLKQRGMQVADDPKLFIDVVVGHDAGDDSTGDLRLLLPQLEALSGAVAWRIGDITGWRIDDTAVHWFRRGVHALPDRRHLPRRFAFRLQEHLLARSPSAAGDGGRLFIDPTQWLTAGAEPVFETLRSAGKLHRMVGHVRSSQLFAVTLFAGLGEQALLQALRTVPALADMVSCNMPVFEFEDEQDRLGEATAASPHRTQVDVLIAGRTAAGDRVVVLVEVKLSEDGFGGCSAAEAKGNDRRELCATPAPFGGEPSGCFQLRNKANGGRRTYDEHLGDLAAVEEHPRHGCPFRTNNQPMRNLALAGAMVDSGEFDRAVFITCAHDGHATIWRRHAEAAAQTPRADTVEVAALPASVVVACHAAGDRSVLADRYDLVDAVEAALVAGYTGLANRAQRPRLQMRRTPPPPGAEATWGQAPASVTGFEGPWGDAIIQLNRILLEPNGNHDFPAAPRSGDPLAHALGYWTAIAHLLVSRIGWIDPARGLDAWLDAGRPAVDAATAFLRDVALADGQLHLLHEWFRTETGSQLTQAVAEVVGLPPLVATRRVDADPDLVREADALDVPNPLSGGSDPLHLSDHLIEPYATRPEHSGLELFVSKETDDRAALVLNTAVGWYAQLAAAGAALPPPLDGSWSIEVIVRAGISLGAFRHSSRTGLWFQGSHAIHVLATTHDGWMPLTDQS